VPRVVACLVCAKVERIPDPPDDVRRIPAIVEWDDHGVTRKYEFTNDDGTAIMVPEYDPVLEDVVGRHGHGMPDTEVMGALKVFPVDQATWEKMDVVTEVKKELAELTGKFFEESDYYKEEALKCYNAHGNPHLDCPDVLDDAKRIGPRTKHKRHQTYLCHMCLTGDTEVVTREGTRRIADLADVGKGELLVPPTHGQWAGWDTVEVRSFGVAPVLTVTLRRGKMTKVVRATANHRWVSGGEWVQTDALGAGQRLDSGHTSPLSLAGSPVVPSPQGIAHGIVYGDGTRGTGNRPAWVSLFGSDKRDLSRYFPLNAQQTQRLGDEYTEDEALRVTGLPKYYKDVPPLGESRSYLYGFLAGYFAADGCVSQGQATIESSSRQSMVLVKDICYLLGIQASPITHRVRVGIRGDEGDLYRVGIRTDDLPEDFFLKSDHRSRIEQHRSERQRVKNKRSDWRVVSVVDEGDFEEVFCAVVPGVEKFVLADNLVTGNCPVMQAYVAQEMRHKAGLYDPEKIKARRKKARAKTGR
jgi:hypothetical protein